MAASLVKGSGCGTREWREDFDLSAADGLSVLKVPQAGTGELVINDGSKDMDFRVESDGNANALFVDAGNGRVGILNASPSVALDVTGAGAFSGALTIGGTFTVGANFEELTSMTPPSAPAATKARLYADTSGGKVRIMALFPSGVAQQLAIEP